ncbi:Acid sphingomyelin phosphodiesterase C-terminal region [Popillia japonica]|uniref:Sphingomyelin phosphodiesterase n=1 Tax=Popillia japonica TaxID=7064 RepID=A0AAW1LAI2_POPJA
MNLIVFPILIYYIVTIQGNPIIIDTFEDDWDYNIPPEDKPLLLPNEIHHPLPAVGKLQSIKKPVIIDDNHINASNAELGDAVRRKISCSLCKLGVLLLKNEVNQGTPVQEIRGKFITICVDFKIENEVVCSGIFDVFAPDVLPVLNTTTIGVAQICSLCLGEVCGDVENPLHEWSVQFPVEKKPSLKEKLNYVGDAPTFKVLHLSDTHFDPNYEEGSPANCEEPLCCHPYSTPNSTETLEPAGKWGSYSKCDMPKILIEHMLRHIAEEHKDIDYIIWTGDLPPHDVWNQTRGGNLYILEESVKQMEEAFPNIPIFPSLGNHEGVPAGSFPPPWVTETDASTSWLYTELSKQWSKWLPSSVNNTIFHGAFYSVLLRPGFRLISLNMNYCMSVNWWLVVNSTDPAKQLQWLIHELQEAEDKGEKVHIIGHIPPGDSDCLKVWSENFYKIIDRYEQTITAQFYGHTHTDEFEVFYDAETYKRPTGIAYIGPSITTYENQNPGYRIYYVDGDHNKTTRDVLDHETWITDLGKANEPNSEPHWFKSYSAREAYGMETLKPEEWDNLIDAMAKDKDLFKLFYKYYYKESPVRPVCDDKCELQILCDLKSGRSHYRHHICRELEEIFAN